MPVNNIRQDFKCDGLVMFTSAEPTIILDTYKLYPNMFDIKGNSDILLRISLEQTAFNDPKILDYIENHLFINGIVIKKNVCQIGEYKYYAIKQTLTNKNGIFILYFNEFDVNLNFTFNIEVTVGTVNKGTIAVDPCVPKILTCYHINNASTPDIYTEHCNIIGDNNGSYMLMRTNPLLTGNIKLQYFENGTKKHAYLSAFNSNYVQHEIKNILVKEIDLTNNYAYDVNLIFGKYSNDILCTLRDSFYTLDPMSVLMSYENAYCDEYDYGAVTNNEKVYSFAQIRLLAPIYIQNDIPDYFVIFRRPVLKLDITDNVIEQAAVVKIIDLRAGTEFGDYLRRTAKQCRQFAHNTYAQSNRRPTKFVNGLLPMTGVYVEDISDNNNIIHETTAEDNLLLTYNALAYNNVIHPNIINIEFQFNDPDTPDFKIQNYYGLYMSEHNIQTIAHVLNTGNSGKSRDIKQASRYQAYTPLRKQINIRDSILDILNASAVQDRIFSMSTIKDVRIVRNESDVTEFINQCVVNQPGTAIGHSFAERRNISNEMDSFITITFDREIHAGEHFRIISPNTNIGIKGSCDVYEFIASDDERLLRYNIPVGHYVQTNSINGINIYSIPFYVYKDEYKNEYASLKDLIKYFAKAVAKMANFVNVYTISDNSIAIYSTLHNLVFQHLVEPNLEITEDYIHYYNPYHNTPLINVHTYDTFTYYAYNNPITEINSVRISSLAGFLNFSIFDNKYVYEISSEFDEVLSGTIAPLYHSENSKNYYSLNPINILENTELYMPLIDYTIDEQTVYTIISPFDTSKRIISTDTPIHLNNSQCTLYYTRLFNFSVLGIHPVKDIIADVYKPYTYQQLNAFDNAVEKNTLAKQTEYSDHVFHSSLSQLEIPANTVINLKHQKEIQKFVLYVISGDIISDVQINNKSRIMFISDTEMLFCTPTLLTMTYYDFKNSELKTGTLPIILNSLDSNIYDLDYMIMNSYAKYQWRHFMKTGNTYKIPLIPNMAVLFQKTGLDQYYSHESRPNADVQINGGLLAKHYNVYTHMSNNSIDGYVKYSLNDIIEVEGKAMSVRDYITNGYSNAITSLYKKYLKTAPVYYDKNRYRAEFIYNGIFFALLFSSEDNRQDALFSYSELEYYEAILVFDYDGNRNTEIFISSDEHIILIVEHKAFKNNSQYRARYIKHNNLKTGLYESANYYWYDAPYNYDYINSINTTGETFILPKVKVSDDEPNLTNAYAHTQVGYPLYKHIADFAETGYMCTILPYASHATLKSLTDKVDVINKNIWLHENIITTIPEGNKVEQKSFYRYFLYASRYKENHPEYIEIENEEDGLVYDMVDKADQREYHSYIVCNINATIPNISYSKIEDTVIKNLNSTDYTLYFIQNQLCEKFEVSKSYQPCRLMAAFTNTPDLFYKDRYELAAKDMLVFDKEDKELSALTGIDFTFGNTHINNINRLNREYRSIYIGDRRSIPNVNEYWGHVYAVLNADIFMTPWNPNASYTTCTTNSTNHSKQRDLMRYIAYWPKMYFGSYAFQLPDTITYTLNRDNPNFSTYFIYSKREPNGVTLLYGKLLTDYIKSLPEFQEAWRINSSSIALEEDTAKNNFINRHILAYYNEPDIEGIKGYPISINDTKLNNLRPSKIVTFIIGSCTTRYIDKEFYVTLHQEDVDTIDAANAITEITIKYQRHYNQ